MRSFASLISVSDRQVRLSGSILQVLQSYTYPKK